LCATLRPASAALILSCLTMAAAGADPWAAPGDGRLRHDLQLLSDAGIVHAPLSTWPVSWAEVARDLRSAGDDPARPLHVAAAFARVRDAAREATNVGDLQLSARIAGSQHPMTLRRFSDVPREHAEVTGSMWYTGDRIALRLKATAVESASDGKTARADGSYAGVALGNWMLSAGFIDRWWGPGWEGSLIYGSNARPIPSLTIERNYSDASKNRWFSWIGQWRLAVTMGELEGNRDDAPHAQLFGMRATWKPHPRLEVGLSRTAQWCGDGRPCGLGTFWDLLTGNDNDQPLAMQPGNQMAGFDIRWSLPWAPVAVYMQGIGEDEANFMPSKYLGLFGAEVWGGIGERSWRAHVEYADTACDFYNSLPQFGCAYRNGVYTDGYQFRDRVIGHSIDGDSQQFAVGATLVNGDGSSWEFAAQDARINRKGANALQSVSGVAAEIKSADVYHRRMLLGGDLKLGIGYEDWNSSTPNLDSSDLRGFLEWSKQFE